MTNLFTAIPTPTCSPSKLFFDIHSQLDEVGREMVSAMADHPNTVTEASVDLLVAAMKMVAASAPTLSAIELEQLVMSTLNSD